MNETTSCSPTVKSGRRAKACGILALHSAMRRLVDAHYRGDMRTQKSFRWDSHDDYVASLMLERLRNELREETLVNG